MADPIFLAPHYDDVALSCGGTVATLARDRQVGIVTVFGGKPEGRLSEFAQLMHRDWGLSAEEVVDRRRQEDLCASRALGDNVETTWLDHTDAIYRDSRYDSDDRLFGEVLDDERIVSQIADEIDRLGRGDLYVPLGVGQHVDHQIVYQAGLMLVERGRDVYGYADLPYALDECAFERRIAALSIEPALSITIDDDAEDRRWEAVRCYASQWGVIFRDHPDPRQAFEAFGRTLGDGEYVDQFWRIPARS